MRMHRRQKTSANARSRATRAKGAYAVGYRRPPLHSRFKKGQSGNPNGRPCRSTESENRARAGDASEGTGAPGQKGLQEAHV